MTIDPIGVVRSCFGSKFGAPRQPGLCPSAWGRLIFHKPYRLEEAVRELDGFSHLWLIFGFHETGDQGWHPTVRPPRLGGNRRIGLFASRSPFRPNPLGLSLVTLEEIDRSTVDGPVLVLGGIDLVDGTPVYDIKPYIPYAECIPEARGGFATAEPNRLEVVVNSAAQDDYAALPERAQKLIVEALALDPRPAVQTTHADRIFGALLCGQNVRFSISENICTILEITAAPQPR